MYIRLAELDFGEFETGFLVPLFWRKLGKYYKCTVAPTSLRKRSQREEVAGDWRWLRNEELHNLYTSPNVVMV